jgi:peptidyl-prolyl cis-trans isomerase D
MLQRMRSLSPVIVAGVIIVFLVLMVIGDLNLPEIFNFGSGVTPKSVVGEIDGEKIIYSDFEERIREAADQQRQQMKQQGQEDPEIDESQLRDQVWNQMVSDILMRHEAKKAGVSVSKEELADIMLDNPPDYLKNSFKDSSGRFMRDQYIKLITNPDSYGDMIPENAGVDKEAEVAKFKKSVVQIEKSLLQQRLMENLQTVSGASSIVSPVFLRRKFDAENTTADMNYVFIEASKIQDKDVKVSDDEIAEYYNKNKEYYKQKPARKIKYINFPLAPSSSDTVRANKAVNEIGGELNKYMDVAQRDSIFSVLFLKNGGKEYPFTLAKDIDPARMGFLSGMQDKQVLGPVNIGGAMTFLRLDARENGGDTIVRASHILVSFNANKDSAKSAAEAIAGRVRGGEDFAKVAMETSKDPGSAQKGGDLDFFSRGRMVPEFEKAAFSAAVGSIVGPIESQFGYHIIKVTDKKSERIKYSEIPITLTMSSATKKTLLRDALSVKDQLESGVNFDSLGKKLKKNVTESVFFDKNSPILGSMDITQFAFNNNVGSVSKPMEMKYYGYVIVQVSDMREEGIKKLEDMKDEIKLKLVRTKKLDMIKSKAESVAKAVQSAGTLDAARTIDTTLTVRSAAQVKETAPVNGLGQDIVFVANALMQKVGSFSNAIRGEKGYFVVQLTALNKPDDSKFKTESEALRTKLTSSAKQSAFYTWLQAVRDKADIEDNRGKIYSRN